MSGRPFSKQDNHNGLMGFAAFLIVVSLLGWLLYIGQSVIIPVVLGGIFLLILNSTAKAIGGMRWLSRFSRRTHRILALLIILAIVLMLIILVADSVHGVTVGVPVYTENLRALGDSFPKIFGLELPDDWMVGARNWLEQLDLSTIFQSVVSSLGGIWTVILTSLVYTALLLADTDDFSRKAKRAFPDKASSEAVLALTQRISDQVGRYLAAKTLVNMVLAVASFCVMFFLGLEFAIFWAVLIGLLNYIPYIGSVIAVFFPVLLAVLQFGTFTQPAILFAFLMVAQLIVGYYFEPRYLGRSVNMSAFVVLLSLAVWGSLWGVVGAILAVPLTSVTMIVLAKFAPTRTFAILMSSDGDLP